MKHLYQVFFAVLLFVSLPVCLHAEGDYFEGFSMTLSLSENISINSFENVPTETLLYDSTMQENEIYSDDNLEYYVPSLEVSMAYNWNDKFIGISGFGFQPKRAEGEYSYSTPVEGQSSGIPFYIDQYIVGGILEIGWCSTAQGWIFASTGGYAGTTYGDPTFHFAFGFGRYYRSIKSDVPEFAGTEQGWMGSLRFQYLIVWGLGLEIHTKVFDYDFTTLTFGLGVFYKIF